MERLLLCGRSPRSYACSCDPPTQLEADTRSRIDVNDYEVLLRLSRLPIGACEGLILLRICSRRPGCQAARGLGAGFVSEQRATAIAALSMRC
jgi:hypothetical protein